LQTYKIIIDVIFITVLPMKILNNSLTMQTITPFLWFDNNAKEAMNFYTSIFKNSKIISDTPMIVIFELNGQKIMALNGGPQFTFNESMSLFVSCNSQEEVDELWEKLSVGGQKGKCGWLKDKYGLSWQIVPTILEKLMSDKDTKKSQRVMDVLLKMTKIETKILQEAFNQN
jgi:predicted 3-demethylubiquinone-9 3-methyltransferase (glyoxalase superfamily)